MPGETDHCRYRLLKYCQGQGLDLGCGGVKIKPDVIGIDLGHPAADSADDARILKNYGKNQFDFIYSSHLLEEIDDTEKVLVRWLEIIKPGGYLVLYQVDKDYYYPIGDPNCNRSHLHHFYWEELWKILEKIGGTKLIHHGRYGKPSYSEWSFELVVQKVDPSKPQNEEDFSGMGISILTPTYKHPDKLEKYALTIQNTAKNPEKIEMVFGIHSDDTETIKKITYLQSVLKMKIKPITIEQHLNGAINMSYFWNQIYPHASQDIIGFFGDDVLFKTPGWDIEVYKEFKKDLMVMVSCNDVHVQKGVNAVLFFTHRSVHDKLGFYLNQKYQRWYMDTFLDRIYRRMGKLHYREDIVTEHLDPVRSKHDTTEKIKQQIDEDEKIWYSTSEQEINECLKKLV
jgi:hypothetical protein